MKKPQMKDYMPVMFANHTPKKQHNMDDVYVAKRVAVDDYDTEAYSLYNYHKPVIKCIGTFKS